MKHFWRWEWHQNSGIVAPGWAIDGVWAVTWLALLATLWNLRWAPLLIGLVIGNALLFLILYRGRVGAFAVQVRLAFVIWNGIALGFPSCHWMLYIPAVGMPLRLTVGYCLLARMVWLLPWNRTQSLSPGLIWRTFFSAPTDGQFRVGSGVDSGPVAPEQHAAESA